MSIKQLISATLLCVSLSFQAQQYTGFTPAAQAEQQQLEQQFVETVNQDAFQAHLKTLTVRPHVAGNPANEMVRDYISEIMIQAGWDVKLYPYDIYMSANPGTSSVELVSPVRKTLAQQEQPIAEDPFSTSTELWKGWNAYSGSGDVTAEVVYANYGRKEDFEKLRDLEIETEGKIILARYGGNFRGYKAKFAEAAGAAGLIIFTDPEDSGYMRGLVYPEGPYFNDQTIQRGSVLTVDYTGDPLTPFEPALPLDADTKVERLDPSKASLHTIPVTPIGYASAKEIMEQMTGQAVPVEWQGGLPFTYRVTGGKDLKVRLMVDQKRDFVRINNVVGMLRGTEYPDEWIILGCHYDAWGYGATDPNSGTAMLLSLSETLGKLAAEGKGPKRSILIAHWDAEEHGVIGSSEWVEQMREELQANAVAYMNFDGGVAGKHFGASASPSLKRLITDAAMDVEYPYAEQTLYEHWAAEKESPEIGNLGGGSDHIAFYMHAGVPSLSGGAGGTTVYHSNYDNFYYYSKFVDPEFQMGPTIEKLTGLMTLRLANAHVIPYDVPRYANDLAMHFENANEKIRNYDEDFQGFKKAASAIEALKRNATQLENALSAALENGSLNDAAIRAINQQLISLEQSFLDEKGMDFGPWYRSLYAASDPFSGYASWILPGLEYEIANKASNKWPEWDERYSAAINRLNSKIEALLESM